MDDPELPSDPVKAAAVLRETAESVPNTQRDLGPWDFIDRLPDETKERTVRPALHDLLFDSRPRVRELAASALANLAPSPATLSVLLKAATSRTALYKGVRAENVSLAHALQHTLSVFARGSGQEAAFSKAILGLTGDDMPVVSAFGVIGTWDVDRSIELARRHAQNVSDTRAWTSLVMVVGRYHRDRLLELLGSLRAAPAEARQGILAETQQVLSFSDGDAKAFAESEGFPAPIRPRPSLEQCKQALGV